MANNMKKSQISNRVVSMIIGILVGVTLVILGSVVGAGRLIDIALIVWGVIIMISNIPGLIASIATINEKGSAFDLVMSALGILLGLGLIISRAQVVTVLVAAYMIAFPVIRIVLAKSNWAEQLKREALRIILGVVMLVFGGVLLGAGVTVLNVLLTVIGWIIIGLTAVFGIVEVIRLAVAKGDAPAKGGRTYVDVDGDGTIDEIHE